MNIEKHTPGLIIQELLKYTDSMLDHAREGDWALLECTDQARHQLISGALDSGVEFSPSKEQVSVLQEMQATIEALAMEERDRMSASFGQSRKKLDQCSYYLRNENQPPAGSDLHNRSL